jgi:uncharacterized protein (DUF1810 family)
LADTDDPHDLRRFVDAQARVYERALEELQRGRKTSHWMWFVFPQLRGLGQSPMAHEYGIASLDEARAYLAHPLLGARLRECTAAVNAIDGRSAHDVFGSPDDMKFRSSMTLFHLADPHDVGCTAALDHYFDGETDARTVELLETQT